MLHCYRDATDWIVAESPEDACLIQAQNLGDEGTSPDSFSECDPNSVLHISCDDADLFDGKHRQSKTIAEWIAWNGRGVLCSTEF